MCIKDPGYANQVSLPGSILHTENDETQVVSHTDMHAQL